MFDRMRFARLNTTKRLPGAVQFGKVPDAHLVVDRAGHASIAVRIEGDRCDSLTAVLQLNLFG